MPQQSLVMRKTWSLEDLLPESNYYLNEIKPRCVYKDGKATENLAGYVYTVTNITSFTQISVFVEQQKPLIEPAKLADQQEAGEQTFVEFTDAIVRPYYNANAKCICDSIKAKAVKLVILS